jgi:hypothetical protein
MTHPTHEWPLEDPGATGLFPLEVSERITDLVQIEIYHTQPFQPTARRPQ